MKIFKTIGRARVFAGLLILSASIANADNRADQNASDRYMYFGGSVGISEPIVKSFTNEGAKFRLKQSRMIEAHVGYSFYPNMMIDISGEHKPKYGLSFVLPERAYQLSPTVVAQLPAGFGNQITIPSTPGMTKVSSTIYMVNLTYQSERAFMGLKPYATFGVGMARISIKPTTVTTTAFAPLGANNKEFFRITKNTVNCFAWQAGGGIVHSLTDNIDIDFGAKLQVVNDIKLKYDIADDSGFVPQKPIKKAIGVGEFTLGFTFKIPV